ncbi:MAG: terminase small subunit [Bacteroidota bacterium]
MSEEKEAIGDDLTDRQEKFCHEYLIDLNATQAAIRAGYTPEHATVQGSRLLTYANVLRLIDKLKKERNERTKIDQDWILNRFKEISDRCLQAEPVLIHDGERWVESGEYKFDASGANKATEMLAKHVGFFGEHNHQKQQVTQVVITKRVIEKGDKRD